MHILLGATSDQNSIAHALSSDCRLSDLIPSQFSVFPTHPDTPVRIHTDEAGSSIPRRVISHDDAQSVEALLGLANCATPPHLEVRSR